MTMETNGLSRQAEGGKERRDARHAVLIPSRMRAGGRPMDVCVRNVSTRGLCVVAPLPPATGTIVELMGPYAPIVGRVKWVGERRFGIEVRGQIDVAALVMFKDRRGPGSSVPAPDTRPVARPAISRQRHESRHIGKFLQFGFIAFLAGCAATFMAQVAYDILSRPAAAIAAGLDPSR